MMIPGPQPDALLAYKANPGHCPELGTDDSDCASSSASKQSQESTLATVSSGISEPWLIHHTLYSAICHGTKTDNDRPVVS